MFPLVIEPSGPRTPAKGQLSPILYPCLCHEHHFSYTHQLPSTVAPTEHVCTPHPQEFDPFHHHQENSPDIDVIIKFLSSPAMTAQLHLLYLASHFSPNAPQNRVTSQMEAEKGGTRPAGTSVKRQRDCMSCFFPRQVQVSRTSTSTKNPHTHPSQGRYGFEEGRPWNLDCFLNWVKVRPKAETEFNKLIFPW